jgi:hypothetical protein
LNPASIVSYSVVALELILNLVWLAISAGFFCYFAKHRVPGSRYGLIVSVLAMVCLSCLLFPVVSMTDDLNSSPVLPETTKFRQLLHPGQLALGMFAHLLVADAPQRVLAHLSSSDRLQKVQMQSLSSNLNRRPPPVLVSL